MATTKKKRDKGPKYHRWNPSKEIYEIRKPYQLDHSKENPNVRVVPLGMKRILLEQGIWQTYLDYFQNKGLEYEEYDDLEDAPAKKTNKTRKRKLRIKPPADIPVVIEDMPQPEPEPPKLVDFRARKRPILVVKKPYFPQISIPNPSEPDAVGRSTDADGFEPDSVVRSTDASGFDVRGRSPNTSGVRVRRPNPSDISMSIYDVPPEPPAPPAKKTTIRIKKPKSILKTISDNISATYQNIVSPTPEKPSEEPSEEPLEEPLEEPTREPSEEPSEEPSPESTRELSEEPTPEEYIENSKISDQEPEQEPQQPILPILENANKYDFLYPNLDDPDFNIKLAKHKEFNDTKYDGKIYDFKKQAEVVCNARFELMPNQIFVKNFLSNQTPYHSLLLYHSLGSGKTCSAIGVAEEARTLMKQTGITKSIYIIASPNVQDNFRLQLFDETKLKYENGIWNIRSCVGEALLNEINPTYFKNMSKERVINQVKSIINEHYVFMGYIQFANFITDSIETKSVGYTKEEKARIRIKKIRAVFNNRLIVIDEVHNIRITHENKNKKTAELLMQVVRYATNLRLVLLSATPMFNSHEEIVWLVNLMNLNDKRPPIKISDIFDKKGDFKDRDLLVRKLTGYVSYVRGENPYSFPFRVYPEKYTQPYPIYQTNGKPLDPEKKIQHIPIFLNTMGEYQKGVYEFIVKHTFRDDNDIVTGGKSIVNNVYNLFKSKPKLSFWKKEEQKIKQEIGDNIKNIYLENNNSNSKIKRYLQENIINYIKLNNNWKKELIDGNMYLYNNILQEAILCSDLPNNLCNNYEEQDDYKGFDDYNTYIYAVPDINATYNKDNTNTEGDTDTNTDEWVEKYDDNAQANYLYNSKTGDEWVENYDDNAQAKYWFNPSTGEASWIKPNEINEINKIVRGGSLPLDDDEDIIKMDTYRYTQLQRPLEALNIVYPHPDFANLDNLGSRESRELLITELVGSTGLERIVSYKEHTKDYHLKYNYEYKTDERVFSPENIGKYSAKIAKICETIRNSEGIVLVYSQWIDGGIIPMALALEEMGYTRYGTEKYTKSLFKTPPTIGETVGSHKAKYMIITGESAFSPNNIEDIKYLNNPKNKMGEFVKVVLISKAAAEGIDFKNIRQIHVMEPWFNMNRIEQIIGRGVRNLSHCGLPFEKRNVEIFLHATIGTYGSSPMKTPNASSSYSKNFNLDQNFNNKTSLGNDQPNVGHNDNQDYHKNMSSYETIDLYIYRLAEQKALKIGNVTRILKETAVDCILNIAQTNYTAENLAKMTDNTISIQTASGRILDYKVGDKPYTEMCDYKESCNFSCSPDAKIAESDIIKSTYNESFLQVNREQIVKRIRELFGEPTMGRIFYRIDELKRLINQNQFYPEDQIYYAITYLIENKNEFLIDKYGRKGNLINRGDYYLFQPIEITDEYATVYERSRPVDFKHHSIMVDMPKEIREPQQEEPTEPTEYGVVEEQNVTSTDFDAIYRRFEANFEDAFSDESDTSKNWYKNIQAVLEHTDNRYGITQDLMKKYVVVHMLDEIPLIEKLVILKNIYGGSWTPTSELDIHVKDYFDNRILTTDSGIIGIPFSDDKITKIYGRSEDGSWNPVEFTDLNALMRSQDYFQKNIFNKDKLNQIIGFPAWVESQNEYVFKMRDITDSVNKRGARVNQATTKDIITKINAVLGEQIYTVENVVDFFGKNKNCLVVLIEILLRHFQETKRNDKIWVLTNEQVVINGIYNWNRK